MIFLVLGAAGFLLLVVLPIYGAWREYMRTGGAAARRHYVYVDAAWDADGRESETTPRRVYEHYAPEFRAWLSRRGYSRPELIPTDHLVALTREWMKDTEQ